MLIDRAGVAWRDGAEVLEPGLKVAQHLFGPFRDVGWRLDVRRQDPSVRRHQPESLELGLLLVGGPAKLAGFVLGHEELAAIQREGHEAGGDQLHDRVIGQVLARSAFA